MFFSSAGRTALDSIKYLHLKVCLTNIEKNNIFFKSNFVKSFRLELQIISHVSLK